MVNYFVRVNCLTEYLHRYAVRHAFCFFVFCNKDPYYASEGVPNILLSTFRHKAIIEQRWF